MSKHQLSETENKLLMKGFDWETDSNGYDPSWDDSDVLKQLNIDPTLTAKPLSQLTKIPVHRVIAATIRLKTSGKLPKIPPPNIVKFPIPEICSTGNVETVEATQEPLTVITLWQPWATFIIKGIKTYETRSWPTNYRGRILIHAAKRPINWDELDLESLECYHPDVKNWDYPLGAIVGEATLENCIAANYRDLDVVEKLCGNFETGRFAWEMRNIKPLLIPNVKGKQGLWKYDGGNTDVVLGESVQSDELKIKPDIPHWLTGKNAAEAKALIDLGFWCVGSVDDWGEVEASEIIETSGDWQFNYDQIGLFVEARCGGAIFNINVEDEQTLEQDRELVNKAIAAIKEAAKQWGEQFGEQLDLLELITPNCEQSQANILLTEPPRQIEANGQLSLFFDDSEEPPDPDDYGDKYEEVYDIWSKQFPEIAEAVNKSVLGETTRLFKKGDHVQKASNPKWVGEIKSISPKKGITVRYCCGFESVHLPNELTLFSTFNSFFKIGDRVTTQEPNFKGVIFTVTGINLSGMVSVSANNTAYSFPANWLDHHLEKIESKSKSIPVEQTDSKGKTRPAKGCGSGYLKVRYSNIKRNEAKGKPPDCYYVYYYSYSNQYGKEIKSSISVPRSKIAQVKSMIERKEHYVKVCKFLGKSLPLSY